MAVLVDAGGVGGDLGVGARRRALDVDARHVPAGRGSGRIRRALDQGVAGRQRGRVGRGLDVALLRVLAADVDRQRRRSAMSTTSRIANMTSTWPRTAPASVDHHGGGDRWAKRPLASVPISPPMNGTMMSDR